MAEHKIYDKGETVTESGIYVCVPCGYRQHYEAGDIFGECTGCLAGTEEGQEEFIARTGLWEKLET